MRGIILTGSGLFFSIIFLFNSSCFNKQDHDITKPNVPEYILSGSTLDYVTGEPVSNTQIRVQGVAMLYDISFPTQTITSDSVGNYIIDPVYPGSYTIQIIKDDCLLKPQNIQIGHEDREFSLNVPEIQYGNVFPHAIKYDLDGIFRMGSNKHPCFAIYGLQCLIVSEFCDMGISLGYYFCIANHTPARWLYKSFTKIDFNPSDIWQLEVDRDHYYAIKYPDSLMVFDKWSMSRIGTHALDIPVKDVAYNPYDKALYACTDSLLYHLEENTYKAVLVSELPLTGISAMTWNDDKVYLLRKYEDLVYQINKQIQIEKIYTVVNSSDNTVLDDIYDIHFDSSDRFWGTIMY